ncbi:MAG: DHH family phosphoesterase [Oscillospiraceae bacterium]|nr:DHH family phosphoesterase [Oscillospiraceae bacterium]
MRIDLTAAAAWLREHDNFVILTHRRPDGDAVGSAGALCMGLRQLGKRAVVLENPQFTPLYRPYLRDCVGAMPENPTIVSVDMATENLLLLTHEPVAGKTQLAIDHHESNDDYAALTAVRADYAACGEAIYEILRMLGVTIDAAIGEALYVAISTDTGCFRYANTSAHTFTIAAALKTLGVEQYKINKLLFATKTLARMRLEARLTETIEFYAGGLIGLCTMPQAMMDELGVSEDDADGVSGFARSVQGVQIGVMIREVEQGAGKISLRTGDSFNASELCRTLGGGGHRAAAGATVPGGIDAAKQAVLAAIAAAGVTL